MTRWQAVVPLAAALVLAGSGFLNALEATTRGWAALAGSTARGRAQTEAAAQEVAPLPVIAELTTQQARAFAGLAGAIELSRRRVATLGDLLDAQLDDLAAMETSLRAAGSSTRCIGRRLDAVAGASRRSPAALERVAAMLRTLVDAQDKAVRHLKSINRKLTALGVVAVATGAEPPPPPRAAPSPSPEPGGRPRPC